MNYKVSILTIGDEICIGQITNTNASWIANECSKLGAEVIIHSSVGDSNTVIVQELSRLAKTSDCILITGGLGPTHDDITKSCLCEYFNDTLLENKTVLTQLQEMFAKRGRELTPRNASQAMLPTTCTPLPNNLGTAPGMKFVRNEATYISMPGVPNEMKGLMIEHVLPFIESEIASKSCSVIKHKTIMTTGIPESNLADVIGNPDEFLEGNSLAFLPSYSGVRLRISVTAKEFNKALEQITKISQHLYKTAGEYIYGEDDKQLAEVVQELLISSNKTLSVAESCTGGLLGSMITDIPGSSLYFMGGFECYSNESKIREVGVNPLTIESNGAVSKPVAEELASRVRVRFNTDYGIGITGVAGPDGGTEDKPVGTVWIAIADANDVITIKHVFGNDRRANRERACSSALLILLKRINNKLN